MSAPDSLRTFQSVLCQRRVTTCRSFPPSASDLTNKMVSFVKVGHFLEDRMARFEWKERYRVGDEPIDERHRQFMNLANVLCETMEAGKEQAVLDPGSRSGIQTAP